MTPRWEECFFLFSGILGGLIEFKRVDIMKSSNVLLEGGDKYHHTPAAFQCREGTGQAANVRGAPRAGRAILWKERQGAALGSNVSQTWVQVFLVFVLDCNVTHWTHG